MGMQRAGRNMINQETSSDQGAFPSWFDQLASWRGVLLVFSIYGLAHSLIALLAGPSLALDDGKLNVVTQSLRAGYMPSNPPLFEWLLIGVQQITGPVLVSFLVVKYALMALIGLCVYGGAKAAGASRSWAALTAFSLVLFFQFGWRYHQAFTHSLVLIGAAYFFWFSLLRLFQHRRLADFLLFGTSIGLGVLSKYSFLAVLAAALIAALLRPASRRVVFFPGGGTYFAAALVVAGIIALPHVMWLISENAGAAAQTLERLQDAEMPYWRRLADGLPMAVWAIFSFFLPFGFIVAILFLRQGDAKGGLLHRQFSVSPLFSRELGEGVILARNAALIGALFLIGGVFLLGMTSMQERYAIGFLAPFVFWILAAAAENAPTHRQLAGYLMGLLGVVSILGGIRIAQALAPGKPFCKACRQWIPYGPVKDHLILAGFDGAGTLVGFSDNTAGNLRRLFPKARVIAGNMPFYSPPIPAEGGACFFVWSDEEAPNVAALLGENFDVTSVIQFKAQWRHILKPDDWRYTEWSIVKGTDLKDARPPYCGS